MKRRRPKRSTSAPVTGIAMTEATPNVPMMRPTSARLAPSSSRCTRRTKKLVTLVKKKRIAIVTSKKLRDQSEAAPLPAVDVVVSDTAPISSDLADELALNLLERLGPEIQ